MINKKRKYLCVRLKGGIGNQLFIYAFGRSLSLKTGRHLYIDNKTGFLFDKYKRKPLISRLIPSVPPASFLTLLRFAITKKFPAFARKFLQSEFFFEKDPCMFESMDSLENISVMHLFVEGYFQSYAYFADFDSVIKEEIKVNLRSEEFQDNLLISIRNSNAVCMHVRRMAYENTMELAYYIKAMAMMKETVAKPLYFLFSDDIQWCRDHFENFASLVFVEYKAGNELRDLWLMTQCNQYIIANSSFSWWAAYLSENTNKLVIAPSTMNIGVKDKLYPENWVLI